MPKVVGETYYRDGLFTLPSSEQIAISVQVLFDEWTEIIHKVRDIDIDRGRQRETEVMKPGQLSMTLDNRDRSFDPTYTESPYNGYILPMRQVKVFAASHDVDYPLFWGYVDQWDQGYENPNDGFVTLTATDAFKVFAAARIPSVWEQVIRADSPAHWWRLGESSDTTTIADAVSGNANLGWVTGEPARTSGLVVNDPNGAMTFDAEDDAIYSLPAISSTDFTIEALIQTEQAPSTLVAIIYAQGNGSVSLFHNTDGGVGVNTANGSVRSTNNITDGKPHHVVAVGSGTGTGSVRIWVDGVDRSDTDSTNGGFFFSPAGIGQIGLYQRFEGTIDEVIPYTRALSSDEIAEHYAAAFTPWKGQRTSERITEVLDAAGWAGGRDIATGNTVLGSAELNTNALQHLQAVATSEQGYLFMDPENNVTFIDRVSLLQSPYTVSNGTFGEESEYLPYRNLTFDYGEDWILNEVRASAPGLTEHVAEDTTSQTNYLIRTDSIESLTSSAYELRDLAEWRLDHFKDPSLRVGSLELTPLHPRNSEDLIAAVLGGELGDRYTVIRHPQSVGEPIEVDVHIEGIKHRIAGSKRTWETEWQLSPAETRDYFVFGVNDDLGTAVFAF